MVFRLAERPSRLAFEFMAFVINEKRVGVIKKRANQS
jgi:hypothetical protein